MNKTDLLIYIACAESPPERLTTELLMKYSETTDYYFIEAAQNEADKRLFVNMKAEAAAELKRRGVNPPERSGPKGTEPG